MYLNNQNEGLLEATQHTAGIYSISTNTGKLTKPGQPENYP